MSVSNGSPRHRAAPHAAPHSAPLALKIVAALLVAAVVVLVTVGKAYIELPGVWESETHQRRQIRVNPFQTFRTPAAWWAPWANLLGNMALFAPIGFIAYRDSVLRAAAVGLALSLGIETTQFIFAAGFSDLDDIISNTLGAFVGALIASFRQPREAYWVIAAGSGIVLTVFAALTTIA